MSHASTRVTDRHFEYIAERTRGDDDFLIALKRDAAAAGIPAIWISPEQASFMQILLRMTQARTVVEVGTLAGYSAIHMARALPAGGRVLTIEIDDGHAAFAREQFAKSDVADKVELLHGSGNERLAELPPLSADAMFIDADKAGYPHYLEQAHRILRPHGLLMCDNAFAFGELFADVPADSSVNAIRRFNDILAVDESFHSVICPIGDGLWVGTKLANE